MLFKKNYIFVFKNAKTQLYYYIFLKKTRLFDKKYYMCIIKMYKNSGKGGYIWLIS